MPHGKTPPHGETPGLPGKIQVPARFKGLAEGWGQRPQGFNRRKRMNYVTNDTMNAYLRTVQPMYDGVLGEIQKEALAADVPIIPPETARLLSVLLTMQKPKHILEIGTAVGFSAGLMCRYLPEDGTVTTIDRAQKQIHFDISNVTLALTTLKALKIGDEVNIERSAKVGAENGGHNLYGHIEGRAKVIQIEARGETLHIDLQIPEGNIKYFFLKGFIGLNVCSLTVNRVDRAHSEISIDLIPETLRLTTWKHIQVGDTVNYEIDQMTRTLVDTLENIYQAKA